MLRLQVDLNGHSLPFSLFENQQLTTSPIPYTTVSQTFFSTGTPTYENTDMPQNLQPGGSTHSLLQYGQPLDKNS
jgi:hypothetical protein